MTGTGSQEQEPLRLELGGIREDARAGRLFLAQVLPGMGWGDQLDDAALLVSELISNLALHARTEGTLEVRADDETLRISVMDRNPVLPVMRHFSDDAATGRGLRVMATIADSWGAELSAGGKTVWFCLSKGRQTDRPMQAGRVAAGGRTADVDAILEELGGWPEDAASSRVSHEVVAA